MPQVEVDGLTINYDVQGEGEPLLLIPYLTADHACYAFQLPAYTEHFSCVALDLPGSGESDKPAGPYSTDGRAPAARSPAHPARPPQWRRCGQFVGPGYGERPALHSCRSTPQFAY
jgi:pimeloyl-ACP methyl ester carboxylesterase